MKNLVQFIKFGIVGVSNTLICEGIYCILVFVDVPYLLAYFIGFVLSVLNAYYWSNKYVFKQEEGSTRIWWKVLLKTYIAYFWGFLVSSLLLILWIDTIEIAKYLGPLEAFMKNIGWTRLDASLLGEILAAGINLLITVPMNFVINKFWAYKSQKTLNPNESK